MMHSSDVLTLALVLAGTGAAAAIDLRVRRVPNGLTAALAGTGLGVAAIGAGRIDMPAAVVGGLLGLVMMLPGYFFGATGGGDVKLLGAVGTLLGPAATGYAFICTLIAGGVLALIIAARHRRVSGVAFAYAPAIAIGATLAAVTA
jgi:prepilin peptidase CpaA